MNTALKRLNAVCLTVVFLLLPSCARSSGPQFSYEDTVLVDELPSQEDFALWLEFLYQKRTDGSFFGLNFNPCYFHALEFRDKKFREIPPSEKDDEKKIAVMCEKLGVARKNYFDTYDRVTAKKVYEDVTLYVMRKSIDSSQPHAAAEIIVLLERNGEIQELRHTVQANADAFINPDIRRKEDIVYLTSRRASEPLAVNVRENTIVAEDYPQEEEYLPHLLSLSDKYAYAFAIMQKDERLYPYTSDWNGSHMEFLFAREDKVYALATGGGNTIIFVYDRFTEKILFAQLIESGIFELDDCRPKIILNGKTTDPY